MYLIQRDSLHYYNNPYNGLELKLFDGDGHKIDIDRRSFTPYEDRFYSLAIPNSNSLVMFNSSQFGPYYRLQWHFLGDEVSAMRMLREAYLDLRQRYSKSAADIDEEFTLGVNWIDGKNVIPLSKTITVLDIKNENYFNSELKDMESDTKLNLTPIYLFTFINEFFYSIVQRIQVENRQHTCVTINSPYDLSGQIPELVVATREPAEEESENDFVRHNGLITKMLTDFISEYPSITELPYTRQQFKILSERSLFVPPDPLKRMDVSLGIN